MNKAAAIIPCPTSQRKPADSIPVPAAPKADNSDTVQNPEKAGMKNMALRGVRNSHGKPGWYILQGVTGKRKRLINDLSSIPKKILKTSAIPEK